MTAENDPRPALRTRVFRVAVSVVIMTGITVIAGYGGWALLSITARFGYDPQSATGEPLRLRLLHWPERNREVMRADGRVPVPFRP